MDKVRVVIADPQFLVRAGISSVIKNDPGYEIVGEAADGQAVIELARSLLPDVVIIDLYLPILDSVRAIREITKAQWCRNILALSANETDIRAILAINAGALGCVLKDSSSEVLMQAIGDIAKGKSPVSPGIARKLILDYNAMLNDAPANAYNLTTREISVLRLLAVGNSNREIGERLCISERTVEAHVRNIMKKLKVASRIKAAVLAYQEGILQRDDMTNSFADSAVSV